MPRTLLIVLGVVALALVAAIPSARRHMQAETEMTYKHGVRAAFAAVSAMLAGSGPVLAVPPTTIGVGLSQPTYFLRTRTLANLAAAANWGASDHRKLGPEEVDNNGNIKRVPDGVALYRLMTSPNVGSRAVTIRCTWKGKGIFKPVGRRVQNVSYGTRTFTLTMNNDQSGGQSGGNVMLNVASVDPSDPIRDIDCREPDLPANARFDPQYVDSLRGFKVIRFMDWQNTNQNMPVTWATRRLPNAIDTTNADGVAIEDMIALAKQAGADPWFNMPWNADDEYYERFARLVHDTLPADRTVYVELANEVWNMAFPVSRQALEEGKAAKLSSNDYAAGLYRYAEKTAHVMDIWAKVYADRPGKLVRVAACQNGPSCPSEVLGYRDTARHVDALATAPYFGGRLSREPFTTADEVFARIDAEIDWTLDLALKAKEVAARYHKRYITYEAGQHLVYRDQALEEQVERDPRMYNAYKRYLEIWRTKIGDTITLFQSSGPISRYGAWGLVEYVGQPLSEAPKMRAVRDEMAHANGNGTTH